MRGADYAPSATAGGVAPARSGDGDWHAAYLAHAYGLAVGRFLTTIEARPAAILKSDLWNESTGGTRDIIGRLGATSDRRWFGVDLDFEVCGRARARLPGLVAVQADITALPFRAGSFDAVVDLSTLDHLTEAAAGDAVEEYRRVLRERGGVLLVFWQRNLVMRFRLAVKRWLRRSEKPDQHYLRPGAVIARLGAGLMVHERFVAGSLLVVPHALADAVLRRFSPAATARLARWLVSVERCSPLQPLLRPVAGMIGIAARTSGPAPSRFGGAAGSAALSGRAADAANRTGVAGGARPAKRGPAEAE